MNKKLLYFKAAFSLIAGRLLALLFAVLFLFGVLASLDFSHRSEDYFYVYVLDVGQSDAILLRCGEKTMLIDAATATEEQALRAGLLRYGIERLDYLVLTHAHEDHIGNARFLIENLSVETVLLPATSSSDLAYRLITESAARNSAVKTAQMGEHLSLGKAEIEVLLADDLTNSESDEGNNGGTVLRVTFGTQVFLFMADAEREAEARLLTLYDHTYLDCDFLKVGHHGSDTSTSVEFLTAVTPTVAAISCGKQNTYGFPHAAVLQNLDAVGANVYRTDVSGILVFGTDGRELRIIDPDTKGLSL